MLSQSGFRLISSSGRPTWPKTPPALLTRICTAPSAARISFTKAKIWSAVSYIDDADLAFAAGDQRKVAVSLRVRRRSHRKPRPMRHAGRKRRAIARPNPCAAPVTIAVLPANWMFMGSPQFQFVEIVRGIVDARRLRFRRIIWIQRRVKGRSKPTLSRFGEERLVHDDFGLRLRTARSRQMPLCVLAESLLKATSVSSDWLITHACRSPGRRPVQSR